MTDATIFVRFIVPGFHQWAGATGRRAYLADSHRHLFHVEVRMLVAHDDREVEFHDLLDDAKTIFVGLAMHEDHGLDFGMRSCEHLGRELGDRLAQQYRRAVIVTVSEDGECGAVVATPVPLSVLQPTSGL